MNRLQAELQRLYAPAPDGVRGLVLELARPGDWSTLAAAWRGVQAELGLPAPAIAVSGTDALQLWFSLAGAVPLAQGLAFLEALRGRYLRDSPAGCVCAGAAPGAGGAWPPAQLEADRSSAFIAADLAPLFSDEPWLAHPPGAEAQAELLSRMSTTATDVFGQACARLQQPAAPQAVAGTEAGTAAAPGAVRTGDPREFLLGVMNDPAAPLALRIEAAKALLPRS